MGEAHAFARLPIIVAVVFYPEKQQDDASEGNAAPQSNVFLAS